MDCGTRERRDKTTAAWRVAVSYFRVTEQRRIREGEGDRPREWERDAENILSAIYIYILIFQYFARGACRGISNRKWDFGIRDRGRDKIL